MIELHQIGTLACPVIVCDSCGEQITKIGEAAAVYKNFMHDGEKTSVLHVHKNFVKGDCMTKAEDLIRSKEAESGWVELGEHLAFLVRNVGMTPSDIEKRLSSPGI